MLNEIKLVEKEGFVLRKIVSFFVVIYIFMLLCGCSNDKKNKLPSDEELTIYLQQISKVKDISKYTKSFNFAPDVEDVLLNHFKSEFFNIYSPYLFSENGGVSYDDALTFAQCVSSLGSVCDGKTSLYRNDKLLDEFFSEDNNGNSYDQLGDIITYNIYTKRYESGGVNDYSLRGTELVAEFSFPDEDWINAAKDKDFYKYLQLKVTIKDKNTNIQ